MPSAPLEQSSGSPIYGRLYGVVGWLYDKTPYARLVTVFGESPAAAEIYQLASVATGAAIVGTGWGPSWIVAAIAIYRIGDIWLNATWWSFVRAPLPVLNAKRSLGMFLVNLVEVVIWYAVLGIAAGCAKSGTLVERTRAVYSSLRTTVTIGPIEHFDDGAACMSLHMVQIVESFFISALIIASLLSAIQRGEGDGVGPGAG